MDSQQQDVDAAPTPTAIATQYHVTPYF